MFGFGKSDKHEDDDTFVRRIRSEIEEKSGDTSGIRVFEHADESALDDKERQILANLREAHEKWKSEHEEPTEDSYEDAYSSVRVKVTG